MPQPLPLGSFLFAPVLEEIDMEAGTPKGGVVDGVLEHHFPSTARLVSPVGR